MKLQIHDLKNKIDHKILFKKRFQIKNIFLSNGSKMIKLSVIWYSCLPYFAFISCFFSSWKKLRFVVNVILFSTVRPVLSGHSREVTKLAAQCRCPFIPCQDFCTVYLILYVLWRKFLLIQFYLKLPEF